jgi:hypothetical protein
MEEKEEFLISLGEVLSAVDSGDRLVVCGDMNGHVGERVDGFEGVHGGYGYGNRNVEGEMLLEFADAMDLAVTNTWFKKEDGKLVTFESGGCKTVVDYMLVRKTEKKIVKNVTVIQGESSLQQHRLLVGMLEVEETEQRSRKKEAFVSRCKVWKLKETEIRQAFKTRVEDRLERRNDGDGDVEAVWCGLRDCLLDVAGKYVEEPKASTDAARLGGGMPRLLKSLKRRGDCSESMTSQRKDQIE